MKPEEPAIEVESNPYDEIFKQFSSSYTQTSPLRQFITSDPQCIELKEIAMRLSYSDSADTILIRGDSGTGKELFARSLHNKTLAPFVPINMAGLPDTLAASLLFGHKQGAFTGANESRDGVFVAARDGTVFLDEIGDMPMSQQALLLRVLQEREVTPVGETMPTSINCRIVAATNKDLELMSNEGTFRSDLYGRLMTFELIIPPLGKRPDDIALIAEHYGLPSHIAHTLKDDPLAAQQINKYGTRAIQAYAKRWRMFKRISM